jgi:hypothetical protein
VVPRTSVGCRQDRNVRSEMSGKGTIMVMGISMSSVNRRAFVLGLTVAICVAAARTGGAQRASEPAGGARVLKTGSPDAIIPFKIHVTDAVLADLKQRLARARFADEIPEVGWDYGTNLAYLKELVTYWRDRYDWRAQERRLNQFDQFKTNIDGLDIHFIHQRSKVPDARPLLLLNGWPSSMEEYANGDLGSVAYFVRKFVDLRAR